MKIDRTRFLLLTTTIATTAAVTNVVTTTGCVVKSNDTDAGSGSNTNDSGPTTNNDSGSSTGDGGTNADADAAVACLGSSADEGTLCLTDDAGPDAGTLKCPEACTSYEAKLKPEVVKAINECLNAAATCGGNEATCASAAIAKACPDPEAEKECAAMVAECGDAGAFAVTQSVCVAQLNATTAIGRETFTSCVVEGDCESCFNKLNNLKNP